MNTILLYVIPILATAIGAFLGFIYQSKSEKKRDKKNILVVLMAYRGLKAREDDFVKALNIVDVYFHDNKKVRELLHDYFKHLYPPYFENGHHERILHALILAMAKDIGYTDIVESDINDYYFPVRYTTTSSSDTVTNEQ
jgi:hypothetical protein